MPNLIGTDPNQVPVNGMLGRAAFQDVISVNNGGTGLSTFTNTGIVYASSTSTLATSNALTFNGTNVGIGTSSPTKTLDLIGQFRVRNGSATSGYGLIEYGTSATATNNWHVGSEGEGSFRWYNGNFGSGTERMRLDSSGNLGIGATPSAWSSTVKAIDIGTAGYSNAFGGSSVGTNAYYNGTNWIYKFTVPATLYNSNSGQHQWFNAPSGTAGAAITFTQAMTLDASGNLGIGTSSPGGLLGVNGATIIGNQATTGTDGSIRLITAGGVNYIQSGQNRTSASAAPLVFADMNGSSEWMRLTSTGNLGLGVTPSAWGTSAFQTKVASLWGFSNNAYVGCNYYFDGTNRRYIATAAASEYAQFNGQHTWYTAPSGTAGAAISFTQAMTLDASGNLGIGTTSPAARLEVVGNQSNWRRLSTDALPFYHAVIKYRGTAAVPTTAILDDRIGSYQFYAYNGTNEQIAASITGRVGSTGTVSATSMPGQLDFYTTPNGSNTSILRLSIDSAGNVNIPVLTASKPVFTDASDNLTSIGTVGVDSGGTGVQTLTGIVKGNGASAFTAAVAGTDYLAPPAGTALLKAASGGALANAVAGTDYLAPPAGTALLKAASGAALANAVAGTDYVSPSVATNFTAPQRPSLSAETAPTTNALTWNLTTTSIIRVNLNANITTFTLTGTLSSYAGYQYQAVVRYNGGTTIAWPATVKFAGGTLPTLTGTSGKVDVFNFVVASNDGGTTFFLLCTGISQNL